MHRAQAVLGPSTQVGTRPQDGHTIYMHTHTPELALTVFFRHAMCDTLPHFVPPPSVPQVVTGMDVDAAGNVYLAGQGASVVYKVNPAGVISIVCGQALNAGSTGDGGLASAALLNNPTDVKVDATGEPVCVWDTVAAGAHAAVMPHYAAVSPGPFKGCTTAAAALHRQLWTCLQAYCKASPPLLSCKFLSVVAVLSCASVLALSNIR